MHRNSRRPCGALLILGLLLASWAANASLPPGPLDPGSGGMQWYSRTAYNTTLDEYFVVWAEGPSIRGYRLAADGTVLAATAGGIAINTGGGQGVAPDVAYSSASDEYLVVWTDNRLGTDDIRGRYLDGTGAPLGSSFEIVTAPRGQTLARVAYGGQDHAFLVTWHTIGNGLGPVQMRMVAGGSEQANPLSGPVEVLDAGVSHSPHVDWNAESNRFLVAWTGGDPDNAVRGQVRNGDGTLAADIPVLADFAQSNESLASVAANDQAGEFLVALQSGLGGDIAVHAVLYDSSGQQVRPPFTIADTGVPEWRPHGVFNPVSGRYLISFVRGRDCGGNACDDVVGVSLDAAGELGPEIAIGDSTAVETHGANDGFGSWNDMVASKTTADVLELYQLGGVIHGGLATSCLGEPLVTESELALGWVGSAYQAALHATCGTAPYTFAVTGGALPEGLALGADGELAGVPLEAGTFPFSVTVTDEGSASSTKEISVTIEDGEPPDAGAALDGGGGSDPGGEAMGESEGCGCRVADTSRPSAPWFLVGVGLSGGWFLRRRWVRTRRGPGLRCTHPPPG